MQLKNQIISQLDNEIKEFFQYRSSTNSEKIFQRFHPSLINFYSHQCDMFERELANGLTNEEEGVFYISNIPTSYSYGDHFQFIVFGDTLKAFKSINHNHLGSFKIIKLTESALTKHLSDYLLEPEYDILFFNNNIVFESLSPEKQAIALQDFEKLNGTKPLGEHLLNTLQKSDSLRNLTFSLQNLSLFIENTDKADNGLIKLLFQLLHHDIASGLFNLTNKTHRNLGFFQLSNHSNFSLLNHSFKSNNLSNEQQLSFFSHLLFSFTNDRFIHKFVDHSLISSEFSKTLLSLLPTLNEKNYFSFHKLFETEFVKKTIQTHDSLSILSDCIHSNLSLDSQNRILNQPNIGKYFKKAIFMAQNKNQKLDIISNKIVEVIINKPIIKSFGLLDNSIKNTVDATHSLLQKLNIPSVVFIENLPNKELHKISINNNSDYALRVFIKEEITPELLVSFISKILNEIDNRVRESYINEEKIKLEFREFYLTSLQPQNFQKRTKNKI